MTGWAWVCALCTIGMSRNRAVCHMTSGGVICYNLHEMFAIGIIAVVVISLAEVLVLSSRRNVVWAKIGNRPRRR